MTRAMLGFIALWGVLALLEPAWAQVPAPPCAAGTFLDVVAHPDDDLLFMNPDLDAAIQQRHCVRTLYLTAGDRGEGQPYVGQRERGIMAAYADMAQQADAWHTDTLRVEGHELVRQTLVGDPRVQLIMLRIPDPWLGPGWGSLTPLSRLESRSGAHVTSYGPHRETYTRGQLVALLASLIRAEHPQTIRLMDATIHTAYRAQCWRCKGSDHPDHIASARLMDDAITAAPGPYTVISYLDYPSQERPPNLTATQARRKAAIFRRYMRHDPHYCRAPATCQHIRGPEAQWVARQYTVDTRYATRTATR